MPHVLSTRRDACTCGMWHVRYACKPHQGGGRGRRVGVGSGPAGGGGVGVGWGAADSWLWERARGVWAGRAGHGQHTLEHVDEDDGGPPGVGERAAEQPLILSEVECVESVLDEDQICARVHRGYRRGITEVGVREGLGRGEHVGVARGRSGNRGSSQATLARICRSIRWGAVRDGESEVCIWTWARYIYVAPAFCGR